MLKKGILFLLFLISSQLFAATKVINLDINYKTVYFSGNNAQAIAINNQIPGPALHFNEGDDVVINVHNSLQEETAIHWHGVLVPWQMDGVKGVNQKGIKPGQTFSYRFKLMQSGTYWYHAHAGLQEQQGLYGAFIINPLKKSSYQYNKDFIIVLSDWINTEPDHVLANLKKDGDYYSPKFPLQPSLTKFIRDYRKADKREKQNLIDDYKMMQQMRMSLYDINDVAYDSFLLNGRSHLNPWKAFVKKGDKVRLRFIGAGAETIFRVKIPQTTMEMIHIQGNDVIPYVVKDFSIAPGETYDVLVTITDDSPYIIYAESLDKVGAIYGALLSKNVPINLYSVEPFPEPLPITREMMVNMMHGGESSASISHKMDSPKKSSNNKKMQKSSHHLMTDNKDPLQFNFANLLNYAMNMDHGDMIMNDSTSQGMNHPTKQKTENEIKPQPKKQSMDLTKKEQIKKKTSKKHHHEVSQVTKKTHHPVAAENEQSMHSKINMEMPTEPSIIGDSIIQDSKQRKNTFGTKYQTLKAKYITNSPSKKIAGTINMELFGYMNHFIWMINGLAEYKAQPIVLEPDKRYRFIFTNNSMMRHPMHIHGHWFILRNGHDQYDPLLHTIEVPPGATVVADVDTEASGQWFFHCHMNYHMAAGMARVFQYSTLLEITKGEIKPQNILQKTPYYNRPIVRQDALRPIDLNLVKHPMGHHPGFWKANYIELGEDPFHNVQRLTYKGLFGGDYNKLELFINDAEWHKSTENADIDIFYWHLLSQFWAIKGGANYFYRPATKPYWQIGFGLEGLLPYFIETDLRTYYYQGSFKLDLELTRDTQITNNFFIGTKIRSILASKTINRAFIGNGLNQMRYSIKPFYRIMPGMNIFVEYEYEQYYGAFKNLEIATGEPAKQNTVSIGLGLIV